jgi:hypothetical protein
MWELTFIVAHPESAKAASAAVTTANRLRRRIVWSLPGRRVALRKQCRWCPPEIITAAFAPSRRRVKKRRRRELIPVSLCMALPTRMVSKEISASRFRARWHRTCRLTRESVNESEAIRWTQS